MNNIHPNNNQHNHHKNNNIPFHIHDLEDLLMCKEISELQQTELLFLKQQLGSMAQIEAYQNMLRLNQNSLDVQKYPELQVNPNLQQMLREKLATANHQETSKSGFEQFLIGLTAWINWRSPVQSGIAFAFLIISLWFGGGMEDHINYQMQMEFAKDSIVMERTDTTVNIKTKEDILRKKTDTMPSPDTQMYRTFSVDSFGLNAILRSGK